MAKEYNDHAARWNYMQELLNDAHPTKGTDQKRKYIQRIDKPEQSAHYWCVNIETPYDRFNKTFCDKKNGGKASALLAAIAYRDKTLKEYGIKIIKGLAKQPYDPKAKGVYLKFKKTGIYEYPNMVAYWHEPRGDGKQIRRYKAFSINKYGYKKAKRLAIKCRTDKLKELYG